MARESRISGVVVTCSCRELIDHSGVVAPGGGCRVRVKLALFHFNQESGDFWQGPSGGRGQLYLLLQE